MCRLNSEQALHCFAFYLILFYSRRFNALFVYSSVALIKPALHLRFMCTCLGHLCQIALIRIENYGVVYLTQFEQRFCRLQCVELWLKVR